jgi:streptomycin 6-kinase
LPQLVESLLGRWELRPAGEPMCGAVALVLPVRRADGGRAMLKVQPVDEETAGEPAALRAWAAAMLDRAPQALARSADPAERRLIDRCAHAVGELLPEAGDRLLHWDLHYDNVLSDEAGRWVAIDPKPLAGDPGMPRSRQC